MALCRRHAGLRATIVDLPGSARVGEQIVAEAGMSDRVSHLVGDMFEADYDGHYDGALSFNIIHHLSPEQIRALFARIRSVLRPGSPLCVLDLYDRPGGKRANLASILGLFFHLTSGADTYTVERGLPLDERERLRQRRGEVVPDPSGPAVAGRQSGLAPQSPRPERFRKQEIRA